MSSKPTIPEVLERFAAYYELHPAWGVLHIVLDDGNVRTGGVEFCIDWARRAGDAEGEFLARLLLRMSKSQRGRLSHKVWEHVERQDKWRRRMESINRLSDG